MRRVGGLMLAIVIVAVGCASSEEAGSAADEPLGELIIQQSTTRTPPQLFVLDLDDVALEPIGAESASGGRWSPDGTRLLWIEPAGLVVSDGVPTLLESGTDAVTASWAADCASITFERDAEDVFERGIWSVDVDGRNAELLLGGDSAGAPDRAPVTDQLVYTDTLGGGDTEVIVVEPAGRLVQLGVLTDNTVGDTSPRWSPDGERIAWASRVNERKHIFVMDADGGNVTQLTTGARGGEFPVWSPDGEWIAYEQAGTTLAIMRADGTDHRTLDVSGRPTDWGPKAGSC